MTLKRWQWAAIVAATVALVVMAPDDQNNGTKKGRGAKAEMANVSNTASSASTPSSRDVGRVELELLAQLEKKKQEHGRVSDVFSQTSFYVPPPPPPPTKIIEPQVPLPPPAPTAPPLPFTYLGRYGNTDARTVVLSNGDKVYTVKQGDVIENIYRVEKFSLGKINLTYLPLNVTQSISTGEAL